MNDERCDRDRVTAILTLAEACDCDSPTQSPEITMAHRWWCRTQTNEGWLARRLLDALDTIDRLEGEKEALVRELYIETGIWRGQALNGGNE